MVDTKKFLHLNNKRKAAPGEFTPEAKHVKAWIDQLPMANPTAAGKAIFEQLKHVNQIEVPPKQRFYFMESLLAPVAQITSVMEKAILGKTFPLPVKSRNTGLIVREFYRGMAEGYALVAKDFGGLDGKVSLLHRGMNASALQRSLYFIRKTLINIYQLYSPYPEGLWQCTYKIFQAADRNGKADKVFKSEMWAEMPLESGLDTFAQLLIMSTANPYRLRQLDIPVLERFLQYWKPPIDFHCGQNQLPLESSYWYDMKMDQPPIRTMAEHQHHSEHCWLDLESLALSLKERAEQLKNRGHKSGLSASLLEHLMQEWGVMQERTHKRIDGSHQLETTFSLADIHFKMTGNQTFTDYVQKTGFQGLGEAFVESTSNWMGSAVKTAGDETRSSLCEVRDQSLGGYRVYWSPEEVIRAQVGEVVGISLPDDGDEKDWVIGVIRWLNVEKNGGVEAGIQLLSHHNQASAVKFQSRGQQESTYLRALLLSGGPLQSQHRTLIVPGIVTDLPEEILMVVQPDQFSPQDAGQLQKIFPNVLVERNQSFSQIDFRMDDQTSPVHSEPDKKQFASESESEFSFDSDWDVLND